MNQPKHPGIIDLSKPGEQYVLGGGREDPTARFVTLSQGVEPQALFDGVMRQISLHHGRLMSKRMDPFKREPWTDSDDLTMALIELPRVVWVFAAVSFAAHDKRIAKLEEENRELKKQVLALAKMVKDVANKPVGP